MPLGFMIPDVKISLAAPLDGGLRSPATNGVILVCERFPIINHEAPFSMPPLRLICHLTQPQQGCPIVAKPFPRLNRGAW